jgi:hypothetical protein
VSGGAITATWVADASSPSGQNLRFTINPGAASDEAYFEQIVPIGGSRERTLGSVVRAALYCVSISGGTAQGYIALHYLTATGTTVGNATEATTDMSGVGSPGLFDAYGHATSSASPPSTAYFLRIRVGVRRNTMAVSDSAVINLSDIRGAQATPFLLIAESSLPSATAPGLITQEAGSIVVAPGGGSGGRVAFNSVGGITTEGESYLQTTILQSALIANNIIGATVSAGQNNWAPAGVTTCAVISVDVSGATRTITGIDATGWTDGQRITIMARNNDLVLAHGSASSTSGNRFACPGLANYTIRSGGGVDVVYSPAAAVAGGNAFRVVAG